MGRGPEALGDLRTRLVMDAVDAPVVAAPGARLYEHLAERYGCDEDYARQVVNDLENTGVIYVERHGIVTVAYDIHPAHLRRTDAPWTPTEQLAALRETADSDGVITKERYNSFSDPARPPSDVIAVTFRSWEGAVRAAGLSPSAHDS